MSNSSIRNLLDPVFNAPLEAAIKAVEKNMNLLPQVSEQERRMREELLHFRQIARMAEDAFKSCEEVARQNRIAMKKLMLVELEAKKRIDLLEFDLKIPEGGA